MTEELKEALFNNGVVAISGPQSLVAFRREPTKRRKEKLARKFNIDFSKVVKTTYGMKYYHIDDNDQ